ncbi:tetratricopeptide repeat protein, partial [Ursidibacter arcticus]
RTTLLATTFAFGLTSYVQASNATQQLQQGWKAFSQQDYGTAIKLFLPIAEQGDSHAQYALALSYLYGEQDYQQGSYWAQKSARQGNKNARSILGTNYYFGLGVKRDEKKGRSLWRQACKQGENVACEYLKKYK